MPASVESDTKASIYLSNQQRALLSELEPARDLLSRRLVHDHHTITDPDLNYVILSSILQALFLKTGQEYGFAAPGTLGSLAESDSVAERMAWACSDSGLVPDILFEKGPDSSRKFPVLPDESLREILHRIDGPDFPVPILQIPLEELAAILEHFLGTKMHIAEGYRVKRVGKSAMLYTGTVDVPPQDVVEYVVNETLRCITERSGINNGAVARVLDPACGAGLFLLASYRFLVCKISKSYNVQEQIQDILRDLACTCIFGADIDPESASTARFVLLLGFIEESRRLGPGSLSLGQIQEVCRGLTKNIRCGNSLIAQDYFSGKPVYPFNADERRKVNPFDWDKAFPEIMKAGGFDIVIGAPPPYRPFAVQAREEYFQTHYNAYAISAGMSGYFIEKGLSLLRPGGMLTVLVPGSFLRSQHARPLRRLLLSHQIVKIANTGRTRILQGGEALMHILSLRNQPPIHPFIVSPEWNGIGSLRGVVSGTRDFTLDQRSLDDGGWKLEDKRVADILAKIKRTGTQLDHYFIGKIEAGVHRVRNNPMVVDQETRSRIAKKAWWCRRHFIPLLRPVDIRRFSQQQPLKFVISTDNLKNYKKCRTLIRNLEKAMGQGGMNSNDNDSEGNPFYAEGFSATNPKITEHEPKIIFSPYQRCPAFCYDPDGSYAITNSLLAIPSSDPFLVGILNSGLGRFFITQTCPLTDRGYHISPTNFGKFPIYVPDFDNPDDKARHDRMVALVTGMLELHKHLSHAKTDQEKRLIQQEIDSTDKQIDSLVYGIYGLTVDEIAVVEEALTTIKSPS